MSVVLYVIIPFGESFHNRGNATLRSVAQSIPYHIHCSTEEHILTQKAVIDTPERIAELFPDRHFASVQIIDRSGIKNKQPNTYDIAQYTKKFREDILSHVEDHNLIIRVIAAPQQVRRVIYTIQKLLPTAYVCEAHNKTVYEEKYYYDAMASYPHIRNAFTWWLRECWIRWITLPLNRTW